MTILVNNVELWSESRLPRFRRSCIWFVVLKRSGEKIFKEHKTGSKQTKKPPSSIQQGLPGRWSSGWLLVQLFCFYCVTAQDFMCVTCSVALLWQLPGGDRGRVPFPLLSCISHFTSLRPHVPKRPLSNFTCPSENGKPRANLSGEKLEKKNKSQYLVKICQYCFCIYCQFMLLRIFCRYMCLFVHQMAPFLIVLIAGFQGLG